MDVSETAKNLKEEQEALASLSKHPGYKILERWMRTEYERAIHAMMDERRREDYLRSLAREAKTYLRVMQRVSSAVNQIRREPF